MVGNKKLVGMAQGTLNILGILHPFPFYLEKFSTKFDLNNSPTTEDHVNSYYLSFIFMNV